jgi:autotransporter-associated beta strand protein
MRARPTFIVASILLAVSARPARAAEFWWTGDLSNGWNSTSSIFGTIVNTNWDTLYSGGSDRLALPGPSDVVRFAASGAIQLNTAIDRGGASVYGVTTEFLGTTAVSVQGGPLTVGAFGIVMDTPSTLTISSSLLTTASSYGITTANASAALLVTGNLTSQALLTKAGPGLLTLQGINTYTSGTNIVQGTIAAAAANALPNNRPLTIGDSVNGSTARLNTGGFSQTLSALTIYAPSVINTTVVDVGTGTLTLFGNLTLLNTTNNAGNLWGATIAGSSGSRLDLGGGIRDITLAGQRISQNELVVQPVITNGAIALNANPSTLDGTPAGMVLAAPGPNTYIGGTTVSAGVLTVNSSTTLGPGALTINTGSVESRVRFYNSAQTVKSLDTAILGAATPVIELNGTTLTVNQSTDTYFPGNITGTGSLIKSGDGTLTLAAGNDYSGGTTVTGGLLNTAASAVNALPAGRPLTIGQASTANTARVEIGFEQTISSLTLFARSSTTPTAMDLGWFGTLTLNGDVTLLDTQDAPGNQYGATIEAGLGGALNLGGVVRNITLAGQNVGQTELTVNAVVTNGGINLTANPSSTVFNAAGMVLNASTGPNTYAGGTTVNAGVLTVNTFTTLGPGALTINVTGNVESRVRFNNPVQTLASLSTNSLGTAIPAIEINGTALTVNQSINTAFAGTISGLGSLTKSGVGTLTLAEANAYSGGTTVIAGTLAAATANALPLGRPLTIGQASTANSALVTTGGFAQTLSSLTLFARSGTAPTVVDVGSGTLTLNGDVTLLDTQDFPGNQYGAIIAAAPGGTLNLGGGVRNITLAGQNILQQELTVNAVITNGGINLTANPSSTVFNAAGMVLNASAPNTYAGGTTVNAGTLTVNSSTTLGPGALTLNTAGNVESRVIFNNPVQALTSLNTGTLGDAKPVIELNGTELFLNGSGTSLFGGSIQGTGSLNVTGSGLILYGDNTYTGGTAIYGYDSFIQIGLNSTTGSVAGDLSLFGTYLIFARSNEFTFFGSITGDGLVYLDAPGVTQTFRGTINISSSFSVRGTGTVVLDAPVTTGGLAIFSEQTSVVLLPGGDNTLRVSDYFVQGMHIYFEFPSNTLVTNDNDLILDYGVSSPMAGLIELLRSGHILPASDYLGLPTYLAIAEAADLGLTTFAGQPVDDTTVLAKYTYVGDANLDGQVDALDYERIDLAIGNTGVLGTAQGDLNYDGNVDALDYEQVDLNIGNGVGSPLGSVSAVFVPEPMVMSAIPLILLAGRRHRR